VVSLKSLATFSTAWFLLFHFAATSANAVELADILDGLRKSPYGIDVDLAIGDTLDAIDPSKPKERCLTVIDGNIKADTEGAVKSNLTFRLIKNVDEFQNELKVDYNVEASSSANFGKLLGGGSTLKNFGHFENFLKKDTESALIVIEASAEHGRDLLQEFILKPEFKKLIENKTYKEFRKLCGTHFIRGWTRRSSIKVVYELSNLNEEAKIILYNTFTATANANFDIKVFSADAKTTVSNTLADTLTLAQRLGKVTVDVESTGGAGMKTNISAFVSSGDPTKKDFLDGLLTKLAEASNDFTYANSAPDTFLITPFPSLDFTVLDFDPKNYEQLGKMYKNLLRVDQRLAVYDAYKTKDLRLWEKYFRVTTEELVSLRAQLIAAYSNCKNSGQCEMVTKDKIDGLILDDLFTDGKLLTRCLYSNHYEDKAGGKTIESGKYLSSIIVFWRSGINFLKSIDIDSSSISQISPAFELSKRPFDPSRQQNVRVDQGGDSGDILIDVARLTIDPRDVEIDGKLQTDKIRDLRSNLAQTVFVSDFRTLNGLNVEEVLGRPELENCPAYVANN
jgi:hypothetical protein